MYISEIEKVYVNKSTFYRNNNITSVDMKHLEFLNNDASSAFEGCKSLKRVYNLPNNFTNACRLFIGCNNLEECPSLPDNIIDISLICDTCNNMITAPSTLPSATQNMQGSFAHCYKLENAPIIPDEVTNMRDCFYDCRKLKAAPNIPNKVETLRSAFDGCALITTAPNIPSSVTNMYYTFGRCSNLAGNIFIHSDKISNVSYIFYSTSKVKDVYIPFTYANGVNTVTYNSFKREGYTTTGTRQGVYLKDLNSL
jgi:hypothetical protein